MSPLEPFTQKQVAARRKDLRRIAEALKAAAALLPIGSLSAVQVEHKAGGEPVTAAERAIDQMLFRTLVRDGEGWLSEESHDDQSRLGRHRVWMVDPLDGTREYVSGVPEWCISVGLIEEGIPVAGGAYNPAKDELFLGSRETGLMVQGNFAPLSRRQESNGIVILASRSEVNRGEWDHLEGAPFTVRPVGSVAYKLALVAAGFADATWTAVPKHEWDVAAGVSLVLAAQGAVSTLEGTPLAFNLSDPLLKGLVAVSKNGQKQLRPHLSKNDAGCGWGSFLRGCLEGPLGPQG
jgi:myo-inositol-1(or 4)-monophosphatase